MNAIRRSVGAESPPLENVPVVGELTAGANVIDEIMDRQGRVTQVVQFVWLNIEFPSREAFSNLTRMKDNEPR